MRKKKRDDTIQFPQRTRSERMRDKRLDALRRRGEELYGPYYRGIVNPRKPDPLPYDERPNRDVAG